MGLYAKDYQGRVATSWISDSKKQTHKKHKQKLNKKQKQHKNNTSFLKILGLQEEYLMDNEEWNLHPSYKQEYRSYLKEKSIKCLHYNNLNAEEVKELVRLYQVKLQKKEEKRKGFRKKKEASRQMRKMISETREEKVFERRAELMNQMTEEMKKFKVVLGAGDYLEERDRAWNRIYEKLHSHRNCHLFDMQSDNDWYQFLIKG